MNESFETRTAPAHVRSRGDSFFSELIKFALIAFIVVVPVRLFVAQPFIVSGASMSPTFENGEYLIVDELSYRFTNPERGDVVVFRYPRDPSKFFIKRIIGLPGETVAASSGGVRIINTEHPDGVLLAEPYISAPTAPVRPTTLGDSQYFVLGDNRPASSDSRIWGPLDTELIVGRVFVRLLPIARADVLPGTFSPLPQMDTQTPQ